MASKPGPADASDGTLLRFPNVGTTPYSGVMAEPGEVEMKPVRPGTLEAGFHKGVGKPARNPHNKSNSNGGEPPDMSHGERISALEVKVDNLATKSDLYRLLAKVLIPTISFSVIGFLYFNNLSISSSKNEVLAKIEARAVDNEKRFSSIEQSFIKNEARFDNVDFRLSNLENDMKEVKSDLKLILQRLPAPEGR